MNKNFENNSDYTDDAVQPQQTNLETSSETVVKSKKKTGIIIGICCGAAIIVAAVIILIVVLSGKGDTVKTPDELIKGKWTTSMNGQQVYLEFKNDGTAVFTEADNNVTTGTYRTEKYLADDGITTRYRIYFEMKEYGERSTYLDLLTSLNTDYPVVEKITSFDDLTFGPWLIKDNDIYIYGLTENEWTGDTKPDKYYHLTRVS